MTTSCFVLLCYVIIKLQKKQHANSIGPNVFLISILPQLHYLCAIIHYLCAIITYLILSLYIEFFIFLILCFIFVFTKFLYFFALKGLHLTFRCTRCNDNKANLNLKHWEKRPLTNTPWRLNITGRSSKVNSQIIYYKRRWWKEKKNTCYFKTA